MKMNKYTIIQSGGLATRMDYICKNRPKILTPLQNENHLINIEKTMRSINDPTAKTIIIVSEKYKEFLENYLFARGMDHNVCVVAPKEDCKGNIAGLKEAHELIYKLEEKKPFLATLMWSDLFFDFKEESDRTDFKKRYEKLKNKVKQNKNNLYIWTTNKDKCSYRYCCTLKKIEAKEPKSSEHVGVLGGYVYNSENNFIKKIVEKNQGYICDEVIKEGLKLSLSQTFAMDRWVVDNGNEKKYWKNRNQGYRTRIGNEIVKQSFSVIKKTPNTLQEVCWYQEATKYGFAIPEIKKYTNLFYEMERIDGRLIKDIEDLDLYKLFLSKTISSLKKSHKIKRLEFYNEVVDSEYVAANYFFKTKKRIEKFYLVYKEFANEIDCITKQIKALNNLYLEKQKNNKNFKCFCHGDPTGFNILESYREGMPRPIFIDPKGVVQNYDRYFDYAKLLYSECYGYADINAGQFKVENNKVVFLGSAEKKRKAIEIFNESFPLETDRFIIKYLVGICYLRFAGYVLEDTEAMMASYLLGKQILNECIEGNFKFGHNIL